MIYDSNCEKVTNQHENKSLIPTVILGQPEPVAVAPDRFVRPSATTAATCPEFHQFDNLVWRPIAARWTGARSVHQRPGCDDTVCSADGNKRNGFLAGAPGRH